jgi:hypothetical protein
MAKKPTNEPIESILDEISDIGERTGILAAALESHIRLTPLGTMATRMIT